MLAVWSTNSRAQAVAKTQMAVQTPTGGTPLKVTNVLATPLTIDVRDVGLNVALKEISRQSGVGVIFARNVASRANHTVSIKGENIPLDAVLKQVLRGTGLVARLSPQNEVLIVPFSTSLNTSKVQSVIGGKVVHAKTGKGMAGANVSIGSNRSTTTAEDGSYRLTGVPVGTQTVTVRLLGYSKQTRQITVGEGSIVTVDFELEPSASVLDQVVVTGTIIATELKAVPNAITVITAKQIEERGITKIDQLFRGDIPGLFAQNQGSSAPLDEVTMFSRGATALSSSSAGVSGFLTNPIKTYVDGVEMADSKYLSQIDPKSIERIEILTGPQASTIYGSNAINGVMQVFTKRGTTLHPQLTLNLLSGWVENDFSSAKTPQHDYSTQLNGIEGRLSYNAGGSWNYMGPWTPARQMTRTSGFGGMRLELPTAFGRVTTDMTLRRTITQNLQRGADQQAATGYRENGWYASIGSGGLSNPITYAFTGQTLGITLGYTPTSWWFHDIGLGQDASDAEIRYTARRYSRPSDTTLQLQQNHTDRRSLRYTTTVQVPVTSLAHATITMGADAWQNLTSFLYLEPLTLTGSLTNVFLLTRQPGHNTGGFLQTQLGIKDKLFFTYGLRAEWNPDYGDEAQPNYAPRYGFAYTQGMDTPFGTITAKLRASYGRSTRPPASKLKVAKKANDPSVGFDFVVPDYGNFDYFLANPELAPEHQQGGEGGLELYLGTRGSFVVTRYNQTVDGLITNPRVDSVRSLVTNPSYSESKDADGYGYIRQSQYLNVGSIRNQGWELQGSVNTGPFTTRGTYSWTKSRTIGMNPKYQAQFSSSSQYKPGATFSYLPEHTWAVGLMYTHAHSTLTLNMTGNGQFRNNTDDFSVRNLNSNIRLQQNRLNVNNSVPYINFSSNYVLADLTAAHRFSSHVEGLLQVQNLADRYKNDYSALYVTMGRQTKMGFRVKL